MFSKGSSSNDSKFSLVAMVFSMKCIEPSLVASQAQQCGRSIARLKLKSAKLACRDRMGKSTIDRIRYCMPQINRWSGFCDHPPSFGILRQ